MLEQYFFQNIDFSISIFGFLVFLSMSFLHFDAWNLDKKGTANMFTKGIGFLCLGIYYVLEATRTPLELYYLESNFIFILGLMLVFISLFEEKVLKKPDVETIPIIGFFTTLASYTHVIVILLHLAIALQYLKKATKGLHKELRRMFYGFSLLTLAQIIMFTFPLTNSTNIFTSQLFAEYGPIWIIAHLIQTLGLITISSWVYGYVRFRLNIQMFIIAITTSFSIFVITTFVFTFLLLQNLKNTALGHLDTDSKVFQFSVERLQIEALSHASTASKDSIINQTLEERDVEALYDRSSELMINQNNDFFIITNDEGRVLIRAEDKKNTGTSLSDDPVVSSALSENPIAILAGTDNPFASRLQVQAGAPIIQEDSVVGSIVTGFTIDDAFVDSIKNVTGLDVTLYADDQSATTTFVSADGTSRLVGSKVSEPDIVTTVLENGETYQGSELVLDEPYYVNYKPLRSFNNEIIGMLFVGKPQSDLIATIEESFRLTFLGSIILMILSIPPAYIISRYIADNIEA